MPKLRQPAARRYGLAVLSIVFALGISSLLQPYLGTHYSLSPFYAAIIVTAWAAGFSPCLLAIALGYFAVDWFVVGPYVLDMPTSNPSGTLIYFCVSLVTAGFGRAMHEAQNRAWEKEQICEGALAERERLEEELRQAKQELQEYGATLEQRVSARTAQLQETVSSLEGVCYGIAHDLRRPIRNLHALTCNLEQQHPSAGELTGKLKTAVQGMDRLLEDLLQYGRLGHGELTLRPVSVEEEVDGLLSDLRSEISSKTAVITVDRPMPKVLANEVVLRQVLTNLLTNSLKYIRVGIIPRIQIRCEAGERVRISVQDNGIGIDRRYHLQIFKMFERLHSKEAFPGTGIGLAIVKKGVERMGGTVGVESEPGKGSLFWFELPKAEE